MHKILMVLRREYVENVRTKAFWIGTLAFPLLMGAMFLVPIGLSAVNPERQKTIAFVDATGGLVEPLTAELAGRRLRDGEPEYVIEPVSPEGSIDETRRRLEPRILDGELYGILTAGPDPDDPGAFRLYRKNVGDEQTSRTLRAALRDAVMGLRLERSDLALERERLERLTAPIDVESFQVTGSGQVKKKGFLEAYFATTAFVVLLYFMLFFYGYSMTRGVLQEKSGRVMEVLLGSLSPLQLMTGKILGIGLVGLTQIGFYMIATFGLRLAALRATAGDNLDAVMDAVAPPKLLFFVVYFLLGYFTFVSLFAIVGAVCNTEQEAQNLQFPVTMTLLIPMLTTIFFVSHPDSTPAVVFSLVPLFTPMLMFMRISVLTPPAWQIALSIVLMLVTIYVLFRAAAKVFRIGTLMYGKRPTVREILRWARS